MLRSTLALLTLISGAGFGAEAPWVPLGHDGLPGGDRGGAIIIDDQDPAIQGPPGAKSVTLTGEKNGQAEWSPSHGGTGIQLNGWNEIGDGSKRLSISPTRPPGRYAVYLRFARMARVFHGNANHALVEVISAQGRHRYHCNPRQGGQWLLLGVHDLDGKGPVIEMVNDDMTGVVVIDAAALVPTGQASVRGPRLLPAVGDAFREVVRAAADRIIGPTEWHPGDPVVAERLRSRDFQARLAWDTLIREVDRTRLWGDHLQTSSHTLTADAQRIADMAAAWAGASDIDGMGLRGNPALLADTLAAIDTFLEHRWTATTKWDVNWWDFEIGVPRHLMSALCILADHIEQPTLDRAMASMAHFTVDPWKFYNKAFPSTGANRIWMVRNHILRAALTRDQAGMERCRDGLPEVMRMVDESLPTDEKSGGKREKHSRDGWYRDGSFIQHGNLPYVGAYGVLLIPDLIECLELLKGTPFVLSDPSIANIPRWVDDHLLPVAFDGELFPRTTGRTAGSNGIETSHMWLAIALCEIRPFLDEAQASAVSARLKRWMEVGGMDTALPRTDFATFLALHQIRSDDGIVPAGEYVASRTQAAVDLAVHHRPGWAACLSMSSTRIASHEALWGANFRGWNQGEGVHHVWAGDPLRYRRSWQALVDPYRLPGITTNTWELPDHDGGGGNPGRPSGSPFAGGASLDDVVSVAGMEVHRDWSSLRARKAWFFLPDAIVCLGSGISASDGRPCETVVESAALASPELPVHIDGAAIPGSDWLRKDQAITTVHLGGSTDQAAMGWWFPESATALAVRRHDRSGSWSQVHKKSGSKEILTRPWLDLLLDHGVDPRSGTYQYAIFPGVSVQELERRSRDGKLRIVSCTPDVLAVHDEMNGIVSAVFFAAGKAGPISADGPCTVILRDHKGQRSLAVADPTQLRAELRLQLEGGFGTPELAPPGVTLTGSEALFTTGSSKGSEQVLRWKAPAGEKR